MGRSKLFLSLCFLAALASAGTPPTGNLIDTARVSTTIRVLASDSLEGRRSGLPGGEKAAAWIASKFAEFGLQPGGNDGSFFQNFCITTAVESGPMAMRILPDGDRSDTVEFRYGDDFVSFAYGGENRVMGRLVFVGYGIQERQFRPHISLGVAF